MLLVAASFFSYYTVAAKPLIMRLGGAPVMAYTTFLASPLLVALSWRSGIEVAWRSLAWEVWAGIFWGVLVSAFAGWIVWGWVNAVRGVARTAPLMYLMPMVAGAVSWYFIGEVDDSQQAGRAPQSPWPASPSRSTARGCSPGECSVTRGPLSDRIVASAHAVCPVNAVRPDRS